MADHRLVPVSPRHAVLLEKEYLVFIDKAPRRDYVVRTIAKRAAGNMPLMTADIVIAGEETREQFPLAKTYPLHFRKAYYPGRLHGDPRDEFERLQRASEILDIPPPIGHTPATFRSCLIPGKPYSHLSPFGADPEDANLRIAEDIPLASAAGLWRLAEEAYKHLITLQAAGLSHGDAELHNFIVCPSPLATIIIDFESAVLKDSVDDQAWNERCKLDFIPILREAVFLQCALGRQVGALADRAWEELDALFKAPNRFRRAIDQQAEIDV
jgi:hypothetical protein